MLVGSGRCRHAVQYRAASVAAEQGVRSRSIVADLASHGNCECALCPGQAAFPLACVHCVLANRKAHAPGRCGSQHDFAKIPAPLPTFFKLINHS